MPNVQEGRDAIEKAKKEDSNRLWSIPEYKGKDEKLWFEEEMLKMFKGNWEHPLINEYEVLVYKMKKLD